MDKIEASLRESRITALKPMYDAMEAFTRFKETLDPIVAGQVDDSNPLKQQFQVYCSRILDIHHQFTVACLEMIPLYPESQALLEYTVRREVEAELKQKNARRTKENV